MITFVRGKLLSKMTDHIVLELNSVGVKLFMSTISISNLPQIPNEVIIYTHMQIKEDGLSLFGFISESERDMFLKLISISGIGPKLALSCLSTYSISQLANAINAEDISALTMISGLGKKTASRLVLELKGSISAGINNVEMGVFGDRTGNLSLATSALLSMGFTNQEVQSALVGIQDNLDEAICLDTILVLKCLSARIINK